MRSLLLPRRCLMFATCSSGRSHPIISLPDWTRPVLTLPNNCHVGMRRCPFGSWVRCHGKLRCFDSAQLSAGTQDCDSSPSRPFPSRLQPPVACIQSRAVWSVPPSLCSVMNNEHRVRTKKRLTSPSLATTLLSIVSFPLFDRGGQGGGGTRSSSAGHQTRGSSVSGKGSRWRHPPHISEEG